MSSGQEKKRDVVRVTVLGSWRSTCKQRSLADSRRPAAHGTPGTAPKRLHSDQPLRAWRYPSRWELKHAQAMQQFALAAAPSLLQPGALLAHVALSRPTPPSLLRVPRVT